VTGVRDTGSGTFTSPTERQYAVLMMLGSGSALLTGTKGRIEPLVRRGWVTTKGDGYSWVRITPDGLRALALAVEKYGLPEFEKADVDRRVCSECGETWRPKCRCGGRSYRHETREVEVPA
jgi:hypothetical protein